MKKLMTEWRNFQKIHKVNEKIYKQYASRLSEESQEVFWNLSEDQKVFVVEDWINQGRPADHLTENQLKFLKEDIKLDIKVGDVLLGGRCGRVATLNASEKKGAHCRHHHTPARVCDSEGTTAGEKGTMAPGASASTDAGVASSSASACSTAAVATALGSAAPPPQATWPGPHESIVEAASLAPKKKMVGAL